jgi:hypothetical protein
VRSPVAPKITSAHGGAVAPKRSPPRKGLLRVSAFSAGASSFLLAAMAERITRGSGVKDHRVLPADSVHGGGNSLSKSCLFTRAPDGP